MEKRRSPNNPFGSPQVIKKSDLRPRKSPRVKAAGLAAGGAALLYMALRMTSAAPAPKAAAPDVPVVQQQAAPQEASPAPAAQNAEVTSLSLINPGGLLAPVAMPPTATEPPVQALPPANEAPRPDSGAVRALKDESQAPKARMEPVRWPFRQVGRDFEATRQWPRRAFRPAKAAAGDALAR